MTTRLAVIGAGLIGRRHVEAIRLSGEATCACIVDPSDAAAAFAAEQGIPHHRTLDAALAEAPEGAILATPNQHHVEGALACIEAGLPVLVEKPLATETQGARRICDAAEAAGVPLLAGHHRRHNPLIAAAKARIEQGALGRIVAAHGFFWLRKPDDYFDVEWRRQPGAGPVLVNLIHDIDLLRHLCGEIAEVRAIESHAVRGNPVEDAAAILFTFASGALGTFTVSDCIPAPWSWELTAHENPAYPPTGEACYTIGGTSGSLSLPQAALWTHPDAQSWWAPISRTALIRDTADPLVNQVRNLARVIRGTEAPLVPGREGLRSLAVIEAVKRAAQSGRPEIPSA